MLMELDLFADQGEKDMASTPLKEICRRCRKSMELLKEADSACLPQVVSGVARDKFWSPDPASRKALMNELAVAYSARPRM